MGGMSKGSKLGQDIWLRDTWVYHVATDEWTAGPPMIHKRIQAASCALGGRIYVIGGCIAVKKVKDYSLGIPGLTWDVEHRVTPSVESWDPSEPGEKPKTQTLDPRP